MKAALFIVLALSALAMAGPAFNKNTNNQIADKYQQQQQKDVYMSQSGDYKKTQATDLLEKWCFASQMSQSELTSSFKKLVQIVKASPSDQATEQAVMSGRICQGAIVQKSDKSGETVAKTEADAQAHELIKDVYMDALIACEKRECMEQLLRIIESEQVDPIRASYYMTRVAVGSDISSKSSGIKDEQQVKQLAMSFIKNAGKQQMSEIVERQQLLAVTGTLDKVIKAKQIDENTKSQDEMVEIAKEVAKVIVERFIKPVNQQEVRQYQEQPVEQQSEQLIKKIAKRSAAIKALANLPALVLKQQPQLEQVIVEIVENKDELSTVRQSAIECLEENEKQIQLLKQVTFDQEEPTEVRVAAYRALMTTFGTEQQVDQQQQQQQQQIITELIKHCKHPNNQQEDQQFVLYVISHLDNVRSSQQPEVAPIKEYLEQNKQQLMEIKYLCQTFKKQLEDVRKYSRNYKLEQQFNQLESGLIVEGDLVYESESKRSADLEILPKLVRVNVSMPVMGETVNVVELTVRQQNMDEQLLSTMKLVSSGKFSGPESMNKVVESFKNAAQKQQQQQQYQKNTNKDNKQTEADLSIKVDGQTIVYVSLDDFKCDHSSSQKHHEQYISGNRRQTRSIYSQSIVEAIVEHLKRQPVAFNRGINFNLNQRFAKLLDVEASLIAGLRFESRAQRHSQNDFEILVRAEPRLAFESIVGPAKMSAKKLLNRASTKSALGLRLRYKQDELVDFELELPMEKMDLFTVEQQIVKTTGSQPSQFAYLDDSVFGEQDIYSVDDAIYEQQYNNINKRMMKRSVFGFEERHSTLKSLRQLISGNKQTFAQTYETPEELNRLTGLRSLVRVVVSPKQLGYLVQCVAQKVDPRMQSIRVQLAKTEQRANGQQKQYQVIVSTPGSRQDRTTQIRVQQQITNQRTQLKAVVESPMMSASAQLELIHDGRQYAAKVELANQRDKHTCELGFQRGQQSQSGRIAATYKPYFQVQSTQLKRPIQMQAIVSCQWEPKTVISYELKSMSQSSNFVQGKITLDSSANKMTGTHFQKRGRQMSSPIESMLTQDMTLVAELVAQVESHLVKVHHMTQWEPSKFALQSDFTMQHKNGRKPNQDKTVSGLLKLDEEKQLVQLECKNPQQSRKDYRIQFVSECKTGQHQLSAEIRYKQNLSQVVAYKHKIQVVSGKPTQWNKFDLVTELELIATEWQAQEKLVGRTHVIWERQQKQVECELKSNDNKLVKISLDSNKPLKQHKLEVVAKVDRQGQHQTLVRSTEGVLSVVSRTDCFRRNMMVQKTEIELIKPQNKHEMPECRVHVEMPAKQLNLIVDAKLNSGKPSSWIVESPVFVSRGEFSFETLARQTRSIMPAVFRFKTEARDLISKDAYWMESHFEREQPSFVRAHSPIYGAEMSFEPEFKNAKLGLFARNKRSINQFEDIYSTKQSLFGDMKPLELTNKLWAIRSVLNRLPSEQKKRILSGLVEFLNREQSHKHSFEWNPIEKRANFDLSAKSEQQRWRPMRATGRLQTSIMGEQRQQQPSQFELDSEWGQFELEAKPFDGETAFAKWNAHSRHPRSAYKSHDADFSYTRQAGFRGQLKHEDRDSKLHQLWLESDRQPQKYAKLIMDSEKHGKGKWEHKIRREQSKRHSHQKRSIDSLNDDVFDNQLIAEYESPRNQWTQRTQINWQEPITTAGQYQRINPSQKSQSQKYSLLNYVKNVNGRLQSQYHKQQKPIYELDFDFKPDQMEQQQQQQQQQIARLNMRLADQWDHNTHFDFIPQENAFKLSSRSHTDSPSRDQIYDFSLQTRSPRPLQFAGLATEQQEPIFFNDEHESLKDLDNKQQIFSTLFKQPLKLDYTDKFGRTGRFDYDHSPVTTGSRFAGLRQKRAALYYKDANQDIEHQSSLDFYPELMIAGQNKFNQAKNYYQRDQQNTLLQADKPGQMTLKTHTKYGPVVAQIDSDETACELKLVSPIVSAKLTAETAGKRVGGAKLYKLDIDNTQQKMSVEKFIRQLPVVGKCQIAKEAAKSFDQAHFEHQTELLVSFVESIIKLKSETRNEKRPVLTVEAELNKPQEKLIVKVDGKRCCEAQLAVDLVTKSTQFVVKSNDKHQLNHQTRIVKLNDKFYSVESMTTYKNQPLYKLVAKISSILIEKPYHIFQHGIRSGSQQFGSERLSTIEANIFEPKPVEIKAEFDCIAKEARVQYRDVYEKQISTSVWKFDQSTETLFVNGKLEEQNKPVYSFISKINFPGLFESRHCHSQTCQSELIYKSEQDSRQQWAAKLVPGEYITVLTPSGKQTVNWVF